MGWGVFCFGVFVFGCFLFFFLVVGLVCLVFELVFFGVLGVDVSCVVGWCCGLVGFGVMGGCGCFLFGGVCVGFVCCLVVGGVVGLW